MSAKRRKTVIFAQQDDVLLLPAITTTRIERRKRLTRRLRIALCFGVLIFGVCASSRALFISQATAQSKSAATQQDRTNQTTATQLHQQVVTLSSQLTVIDTRQRSAHIAMLDTATLRQQLTTTEGLIARYNFTSARRNLQTIQRALADGSMHLALSDPSEPINQTSLNVPILLYHQPPADFSRQMDVLVERGYTTIHLEDLASALVAHTPLPAKPVVITFDDGFASQMGAVSYLESHNLKATFYIIDGGQASKFCIGANRHPGSCGDPYLSWSQIEQLDKNPLFTIASHTMDHLELSAQTPAVQRFQIIEGKKELEQHLGHQVYDFAYPYGKYNSDTVAILHEAGFVTAVTTTPGMIQTNSALLTMPRIRATYDLP